MYGCITRSLYKHKLFNLIHKVKKFLKQSILKVINGYQEDLGKDIWEKVGWKELNNYITSILRGYWLDEQRAVMRGTRQVI